MTVPARSEREQHGVKDSFHAKLGWVDGYTHAVLAEEWRDEGRAPQRTC